MTLNKKIRIKLRLCTYYVTQFFANLDPSSRPRHKTFMQKLIFCLNRHKLPDPGGVPLARDVICAQPLIQLFRRELEDFRKNNKNKGQQDFLSKSVKKQGKKFETLTLTTLNSLKTDIHTLLKILLNCLQLCYPRNCCKM